jgi:tyrosyl-DNA phosphodiesterase 1
LFCAFAAPNRVGSLNLRLASDRGKMDNEGQHPRKRRRLSYGAEDHSAANKGQELTHSSLSKPISPPPLRRAKDSQAAELKGSPFQLTWIRDLPEASNVDAVSLRDILGDPLIAECWEFNYLHDLDFLMTSFDQDVRDLVQVHVVHGFWKNEDQSRLSLKVMSNFHSYITYKFIY